MKRNPLIATKLVQGTATTPDVSPITLWWPRHAGCVLTYALDHEPSDASVLVSERKAVKETGYEWELLVPQAARRRPGAPLGLMREHVELEVALVDATIVADIKRMDEIARALELNGEAHRARYARSVRRFPETTFSILMREHVRLFVEIMHGTLQGETPKKNSKAFVANGVGLGSLMTEWFSSQRPA